ncbi:MAG: Ham1-like protein [Microgenomates group bacterium GW2011_GWC1_37_8]|uniref:Ham1-like protein n=1 Tax=Candidatus Woesebacteria bacterium GW2011_GWB1_38_8 TaxID=1618570 RepID=A0A0G0P5Y9_9BACT|nr:MAG: Ham1-like protein [Microgenomates group bacterium GW2011_GWC1_37_8]KKQ84716.1 MAG: Ham1-like protein [Candidatus Woesebacteria bacterium GW2011_GWB1_38_8]
MAKKKIIFITNSENKVKEAQEILGDEFSISLVKFDLDEIQTVDGKKVIKKKAEEAYNLLRQPLIVEDTSLYFDAWNGLPGALVRWFLDTVECEGICRMMDKEINRKAWAESVVAYHNGKDIKIFSAKLEGTVPQKPKGEYKFGWDPIFVPKGYKKTFGELGPEEKNKISTRKLALEKLGKYL